MTTVVVNVHKDDFDVYIGRWHPRFGQGSKFANPFKIEGGDTRHGVIRKYREWLWVKLATGEISVDELMSLDGKRLGCFCSPKSCHGDVIVEAIEFLKRHRDM